MYPQKIESSGSNPLLKAGEGGDISNLNSSLSSKRLTLFLEYHSDLCALQQQSKNPKMPLPILLHSKLSETTYFFSYELVPRRQELSYSLLAGTTTGKPNERSENFLCCWLLGRLLCSRLCPWCDAAGYRFDFRIFSWHSLAPSLLYKVLRQVKNSILISISSRLSVIYLGLEIEIYLNMQSLQWHLPFILCFNY